MIRTLIGRIRRNHALEHATIHMLSRNHTGFAAQGHSNHRGFILNLYGNLTEEQVTAAVQEAFTRMKNGERDLAVHPNCGTVLVTTATFATLAAQIAFAVEQVRQGRDRTTGSVFLNGLPSAILATAVALIASRPIGMHVQRQYTTDGDLGGMQVVRIRRVPPSPITRVFRMLLARGNALPAHSWAVETTG
jgi:hypothetical protein